jgi:autophagy-related protein 16
VRLWDARTGNGIKELIGLHSGQITSVSVSPGIVFVYCADRLGKTLIQNPDGSKLLTNSRDNTLHTIDLRMYKVVRTFQYVPLYYRLNTFLS